MKTPAAILALVVGVSALSAQDYGDGKAPPTPAVSVPLTPEQKTALRAVDVRIAGVESLVAKIDEPTQKAANLTAVADLKKRRAALEKNFDPGLYEALMHSVISRYQTVALWLTPARVPGAAADSPGKTAPAKGEKKPAPTGSPR